MQNPSKYFYFFCEGVSLYPWLSRDQASLELQRLKAMYHHTWSKVCLDTEDKGLLLHIRHLFFSRWSTQSRRWKKKRLCLPRNQFLLLTLWASMRFMTRSRSPCTGWSSANCGSTLYNQSTKACKASMNWPENSKASSNLCCLKKAYKIQGFKKRRRNAHNPDC